MRISVTHCNYYGYHDAVKHRLACRASPLPADGAGSERVCVEALECDNMI